VNALSPTDWPADAPVDPSWLHKKLGEFDTAGIWSDEDREMTLDDLASAVLNDLEYVAFGVRSGQIDYNSTRLTLRQVFLRYYIRFKTLIARDAGVFVNGQECPILYCNLRRFRENGKIDDFNFNNAVLIAKEPQWEHFLWMINRLPHSTDMPKNVIEQPTLQTSGRIEFL